jgi:hypothetical protein
MPRVCWEEQLCVSCEFVTINSRCTDFLRSTGVEHEAESPDKFVEAILPVQMRVTTIADAEAKTVAPLLHPE